MLCFCVVAALDANKDIYKGNLNIQVSQDFLNGRTLNLFCWCRRPHKRNPRAACSPRAALCPSL